MNKCFRASVLIAAVVSLTLMAPPTGAAGQGAQRNVTQPRPGARNTLNRASPRALHRTVNHPRVGHQARMLPKGHQLVRVGRNSYRYHNGVFYRTRFLGTYAVVRAPFGARVDHLPPGYISFFIGPHRYFYVNLTYYLWDTQDEEYVVIEEPEGAEVAVVAASESESGEIFVYPKLGQSDEQRDRDRYDCYLWAVEQTDFNPSDANTVISGADNAVDYRRAISACLEGRGYTVK